MELGKKRGITLLFILFCFCSYDRKLREAEKIYDKLELDISSQELINKLDKLEQSLSKISSAYYMGFEQGGVWFNRYEDFISSVDINVDYLKGSPLVNELFSLAELENIVSLHKILADNKIRIEDFTLDYSCNGETIFWYKNGQCGPNNYCERRLYIRKGEFVNFDCFNDESDLLGRISKMTPIDSIGNIYLLKPTSYIR